MDLRSLRLRELPSIRREGTREVVLGIAPTKERKTRTWRWNRAENPSSNASQDRTHVANLASRPRPDDRGGLPAPPPPPPWHEVKSAHFTVITDAGEKAGRRTAWQFEQIRSALVTIWPWAKIDSGRPFVVFAARDESTLKTLGPQFWEGKRFRPVGFGAQGRDKRFHRGANRRPRGRRLRREPVPERLLDLRQRGLQPVLSRPRPALVRPRDRGGHEQHHRARQGAAGGPAPPVEHRSSHVKDRPCP